MLDIFCNEPKVPQRIFFRIPVKIRAKIFLKEKSYRVVYLEDLSTSGFACNIKESDALPEVFELHFKCGLFAKTLKLRAQVKNKKNINGSVRLGGIFLGLSAKNQQSLEKRIMRFFDLSLPSRLLTIAALLCIFDALARILAYLMTSYYLMTKLGRSFEELYPPILYSGIILSYALVAFCAFVFATRIYNERRQYLFCISLFCMVLALSFIVVKNLEYFKLGLWGCEYPPVQFFLWIYTLFSFYVGFATYFGIASQKRIDLVVKSENRHRAYLKPNNI